jgi:hypothetical protein
LVEAAATDGVGDGGRSTVLVRAGLDAPPQPVRTAAEASRIAPSGIEVRMLTPG